jgi:hypothetical protein
MLKGFMTEDGPRPEFEQLYDAIETNYTDYSSRTQANIKMADAVLWFGDETSPGGKLTRRLSGERGIVFLKTPTFMRFDPQMKASQIREILRGTHGRLMVAGNRESSRPGIGKAVERVCFDIFLAYNEPGN